MTRIDHSRSRISAKVSWTVLKTSTPGDRRAEFNPQAYDTVAFEIDHVIAATHEGPTIAENLALACFLDNSYKGTNLQASAQSQSGYPRSLTPGNNSGADTSDRTARYS